MLKDDKTHYKMLKRVNQTIVNRSTNDEQKGSGGLIR